MSAKDQATRSRKRYLALCIVPAALLVLWIVARFTGIVGFYAIPSVSNAPAILPGDHIFTCSFIAPKPLDHVVFRCPDPKLGEGYWVKRLIGMPGDVVEIKNSILTVNGRNVDSGLNLLHYYKVWSKAEQDLVLENMSKPGFNDIPALSDTMDLNITSDFYREHGLKATQIIYADSVADPYVMNFWGRAWNTDQFGPVKVPGDAYFLLGDNRGNSLDSRHFGFIKKQDVTGVVFARLPF